VGHTNVTDNRRQTDGLTIAYSERDREFTFAKNQRLKLWQRDRAAGCVNFSPKVEDWNWKTIFYGHYRSIFIITVI